jgi:hypothetical protein
VLIHAKILRAVFAVSNNEIAFAQLFSCAPRATVPNSAMQLSAWLQREGLTARAFAERIGRPTSTVTRLLNGDCLPGLRLLVAIIEKTNGEVGALDFNLGAKRKRVKNE